MTTECNPEQLEFHTLGGRRWHQCQHAGYAGEPGCLAAVIRPEARVRVPLGTDLRLFFIGQRRPAQLRHRQ